jgi:hypothetical protein
MASSGDSILKNTKIEYRVLVKLENGLTYLSKDASFNTSWANACRFILQAGCKVHSLVPYQVEVSYV